jgi:PPK2 family polyphosphate:nucleotide phosphotransferase
VESRLLPQLAQQREQLQEALFAAQQHAVLIVLQGMDTSGKDGTIKHVMAGINPAGCHVWSFKAPSEEERSHDFLWRVHARVPERGMIAIFNRSHYEDVLIARVHNLVPPKVWKKRYQQINDFEQMLSESGVLLLKFFLHISKEEQEQRLSAREREAGKAWKIAAADWQERAYWDAYMEAYEEVLGQCSTAWAPWQIVPANKKWYRNYVVAQALIDGLEPHARQWSRALTERGECNLAELRAFHERGG